MNHALSTNIVANYSQSEADYVSAVSLINGQRRAHLDERITCLELEIKEEQLSIEGLRSEVECLAQKQQIGNIQSKLVQLRFQLVQLRKTFDRISEDVDDLRLQFRAIWTTPRVCSVWLENTRLIYRTLSLYGKDHIGEWRCIGPFEISFSLQAPVLESFEWRNQNGSVNSMHGPPNISETTWTEYGVVQCAGNAQVVIDAAGEINDFPALVAFSVRYPECPGYEKNSSMTCWPRVPQDDVPEWYTEHFGA